MLHFSLHRFFLQFLAHPLRTGAIIPSSRWLARAMVAATPVEQAQAVVELGPGTGVITEAILDSLPQTAQLFLFETNPLFCQALQARIRDPRVAVIPESASCIYEVLQQHNITSADCILSGLPFRALPLSTTRAILQATRRCMHRGSIFTAFQYTSHLESELQAVFPQVTRVSWVWRNIPPAFVYQCHR